MEPVQSTSVAAVVLAPPAPPKVIPFEDYHANENSENLNNQKDRKQAGVNQARNKKKNKHNFTRQQKNKKWKMNKFRRRGDKEKKKEQQSDQEKQNNSQNVQNQNKNKHANNNQNNNKHNNKNQNNPGRNKRLQSFSTISKFFLPEKRPRKECIIPPTKFLLGGNISDPLNLNSLQNESENAVTPKSSPIPTPPHYKSKIEVIIPPNIHDPLHLLDPVDSVEYELQLCSPMKRKYKARNKKKRKLNKEKNNLSLESATTEVGENDLSNAEENTGECKEEGGEAKDGENMSEKERERTVRNLKLDLSECGRKRRISESNSIKNKVRRMDSMDKIVSPVIPQPGAWKRVIHWPNQGGRNRTRSHSSTSISEDAIKAQNESAVSIPEETIESKIEETSVIGMSEKVSKSETASKKVETKYHYGNYDRYYGYRNINESIDVRLKVFLRNPHLFRDKDVLDVGCNVGLMTIAVAKMLHTKSITGIDIDKTLIAKARKNVAMHVKIPVGSSAVVPKEGKDEQNQQEKEKKQPKKHKNHPKFFKNAKNKKGHMEFFPFSFPLSYGNLLSKENQMDITDAHNQFPNNVFFRTMNYVLKDESLINLDNQQYDLIMCLSVTKWIHLNCGDSGIKITFKRMFNQLRPGGKLILESQNWASYKKKKKLTETTLENYKNIELFPNKFHDYLLSPEVGFSHSYPLGIPRHLGKGFKRPIQLYVKGDFTPSQAQWSDTYHPQTPYENTRGIYTDIVSSAQSCNVIWGSTTPYTATGSYSYRYTPSHGFPATSPYYNPRQSDSYLPSYDCGSQRGSYHFASPLYSTTWSPPSELCHRQSASNTPNSPSIRNEENFAQDRQHVYPPIDVFSIEKKGADSDSELSSKSHEDASGSPSTIYTQNSPQPQP